MNRASVRFKYLDDDTVSGIREHVLSLDLHYTRPADGAGREDRREVEVDREDYHRNHRIDGVMTVAVRASPISEAA